MTSELDAALKPGERVLERGTRVGLRRAWRHWHAIILGPVVILLILHFGFDSGLWQVEPMSAPIPLLIAIVLLVAGLPIAEWLAKSRGSYSAEAIITTHRVLAATDEATIDELRLADVTRVEFVRGVPLRRLCRSVVPGGLTVPNFLLFLFQGSTAFVRGQGNQVFLLLRPGGEQELASAVAAAAGLPSRPPHSIRSILERAANWLILFIIPTCLIICVIGFPIGFYLLIDRTW